MIGHLIMEMRLPRWTVPSVHGLLLLARVGLIPREDFPRLATSLLAAAVRHAKWRAVR